MADNLFKKKVTTNIKKIRAFGIIDQFTCHTMLNLLDKPPDKRTTREIDMFLPSLIMTANCMKNVDKEVATEILRYSSHKRYKKGQVIVRQGEKGDEFFVIIRGTVAVHVIEKPAKRKRSISIKLPSITGDLQSYLTGSSTGEVKVEEKVTDSVDKKDNSEKSKYGEFVNLLGPGHSFGELALLHSGFVRNATIIADESPTDLMIIDKKLFDNTIKEFQYQELLNKKLFIRTHPFFVKWSTHDQEQLLSVIKKTTYYSGQCAIRQGAKMNGLHFLIKGKARLSVEPERHKKQYPHLYYEISRQECGESARLEGRTVPVQELICIRQADGYAAAERFISSRRVEVCIVEPGEVIGDMEYILGLDTFIHRIFCSSNCEFYYIDMKQLHRLIMKKNPEMLKLLKTRAETKLIGRMTSLPGKKVQLFPLLHLQLRFVRISFADYAEEEAEIVRLSMSEIKRISGRDGKIVEEQKAEGKVKSLVPQYVLQGPEYHRQQMRKKLQERKELFEKHHGNNDTLCNSLSKNMRDMILNNVRQRMQVETMIKKYSLSWANENTWLTRWK